MARLDAGKSGTFKIGGDIEIHRLVFGATRITGKGIWGPPAGDQELPSLASSRSGSGNCIA
jgi:pyridoxine 4-dehydrogenase